MSLSFIPHDPSFKFEFGPRTPGSQISRERAMLTLILGGVRSGKSRMAENLAADFPGPITYLATAQAKDTEMQERVALHRKHRPKHWKTIEEPIRVAQVVSDYPAPKNLVVVDCLTLWMTNLLLVDDAFETGRTELEALIAEVKRKRSNLVLVSNETNSGVVPMDSLSRRFCDEMGVLHQKLAGLSDDVILMVAGIPTWVKKESNGAI